MEIIINEVLIAEFWSHYSPLAKDMMAGNMQEALIHVEAMHNALEEVNEIREENPCAEACA
jgi:hypothetical protein